MRIKYGGYKLRGYYKIADLALKYLNMTKPAKTKLDILTFAYALIAYLQRTPVSSLRECREYFHCK